MELRHAQGAKTPLLPKLLQSNQYGIETWEGTGLVLFCLNRLQSNQYGIETLNLLSFFYDKINKNYNRTNMELRPLSEEEEVLYWNRLQSNQYGIETYWNSLLLHKGLRQLQSNQYGIETTEPGIASWLSLPKSITIEPIWNWDSPNTRRPPFAGMELQSNQYGIETPRICASKRPDSLTLQSNQYGIETHKTATIRRNGAVLHYNRTNMELRLLSPVTHSHLLPSYYNRTNMELRRWYFKN